MFKRNVILAVFLEYRIRIILILSSFWAVTLHIPFLQSEFFVENPDWQAVSDRHETANADLIRHEKSVSSLFWIRLLGISYIYLLELVGIRKYLSNKKLLHLPLELL